MPTSNYIASLLELKEAIIENLQQNNEEIHLFFSLKRRTLSCPHCKSLTDQVHDYRTSILQDVPILGKKTFLHYRKRRYHCPQCGKHFYEPFSLLPKHFRKTTRLSFYMLHLLNGRDSVKSVASLLGVSCSTVFRRLKDVQYPKPDRLPRVLSIDEFRGNAGGQKFQAILTDPDNRCLVDILPDRSKTTIFEYFMTFSNRKEVKYVVMDMNSTYLDIAKTCFPNATIVIDKFHVARYAQWAMENVRKRIQKQMHPNKRKYFKRSRYLLLKRSCDLSDENKSALALMLSQSPDLATAYHLKELFFEFIHATNRTEAKEKLRWFKLAAQASQLEEFAPVLTMLGNWATYILNTFDCTYTNGYTEGTNNAIKVIKRAAFNYRNFENFRNRIFFALT